MHPTVPFFAAVLFATVLDDCGNANAGAAHPPPPEPVATCAPAYCSFSCVAALTSDGLQAHPALNPNCPTDTENTTAEIAQWLTTTAALSCADPPPGEVTFYAVPQAFVCPETTCAPNPLLLAPSCVATCRVSGSPPTPASACPSPDENPAMEQFALALEGIVCSDGEAADQITFQPDPELVDTTVCMHHPPHKDPS